MLALVAVLTTAIGAWAEKTITLDYNSFGLTTTYSQKTATVDGFGFTVNKGYKGSGNTIQMNSSQGSGILYNTTAIPGLKTIKVNVSSGDKTYTITTGASVKPTANSQTGTKTATFNAASGDTYFQLKVSGASYFSSIEITYEDAKGENTTTTIADAGITNTNLYNGTTAGSLSASVADASGNTIEDATVTWESKDTGVATIDASTGEVTLVGAGTTTITASYAGVTDTYKSSSATYTLTVTNDDPSYVTIWSEDFSSYKANAVPSGGTYSYVCVNGNSDTRIYAESLAGGTSPELLINQTGTKTDGSFSATIPLNNSYAGTLKLSFKNNNPINVSAKDNNNRSLKSSTSIAANTTTGNTVDITGITTATTSVTITWSNSTSKNVRLDDIVLNGKPVPAAPTFSKEAFTFDAAFDVTITGAEGTTLKYTTDGSDPNGGTAVEANTTTITIPAGADVTVKAVAIKDGVASKVASVTYHYDARPAPTFELSSTEMTIFVLGVDDAITLTTNSDGVVSFESSDDNNLSVDNKDNANVGVLTALEAGDYTVTVRIAESDNYIAAEGTVTVHVVKKPTAMTMDGVFTSNDLYTATTGTVKATVNYNDVALSPQPAISYKSSDESVATVDADGKVTFVAAGTSTITATFAGNDEYAGCEATYVLTLVDTTPQKTSVQVTLNNTLFGCTAFTSYSAGSATSYTGTKDNITVTYAKGTGSGFYCNNSGLRLYSGGSLTFAAPGGYVITKIVLTGEDKFSDGLTNPNASTTWTGSNASVEITGETKSGTSRKNMTGATITLAEAATIGSALYTTYVTKNDVSFDGVTAYIATKVSDASISLEPVASAPRGTAVVLNADKAGTYPLATITDTPADVSANVLLSSDGSVSGDGSTIFALGVGQTGDNAGKVGFYLVGDGVTVPAGKAYLSVGEGDAVKEFLTFAFGGDATGIVEMENVKCTMENVFTLAGQRVQKPRKGLYVVGGKKVLVR